jgi:hypothetical protein
LRADIFGAFCHDVGWAPKVGKTVKWASTGRLWTFCCKFGQIVYLCD